MSVILDSSLVIAFFNSADERHERGVELMKLVESREFGEVFVCDHVIDEAVTYTLAKTRDKRKALKLGEWFFESERNIFYTSKDRFGRAWNLFKSSTGLSFTDCVIAQTALDEGVEHVVTFDEDFKQVRGLKVIN